MTTSTAPQFTTRLAQNEADLHAAQRLRYDVFVAELGGGGELVDHTAKLEQDRFDPFFDHLLLCDEAKGGAVVGVYRLLRSDQAAEIGQFYSESEYDLDILKQSDRRLLELGRSCLHPDYRGGMAMYHLWNALSAYVEEHRIEVLFGFASFHGVDLGALAGPLSMLYHNHLAPRELRVRSRAYVDMNMMDPDRIDRRRAMVEVPALIKAYLRLGGVVGDGAFIDHAFNTTDVCLIMETRTINARQKGIYSRESV